jgi:hypothetical protein
MIETCLDLQDRWISIRVVLRKYCVLAHRVQEPVEVRSQGQKIRQCTMMSCAEIVNHREA